MVKFVLLIYDYSFVFVVFVFCLSFGILVRCFQLVLILVKMMIDLYFDFVDDCCLNCPGQYLVL